MRDQAKESSFRSRMRNSKTQRREALAYQNNKNDPAWVAKRAKRSRLWAAALRSGKGAEATWRAWNLKAKYGMSIEQYDALLDKQRGLCACCKQAEINGRRLSVDHDHKCCPSRMTCGRCIRGLLCQRCNQVLGKMQDSPLLLKRAIAYLKRGH